MSDLDSLRTLCYDLLLQGKTDDMINELCAATLDPKQQPKNPTEK